MDTPVRLPKHLESHLIEHMQIGEKGWTVPWAMYAEGDRSLWLNGRYTISASPGGTVAMHVLRVADGFQVDVTQCKGHCWDAGGSSFIGGDHPCPVVKLIE